MLAVLRFPDGRLVSRAGAIHMVRDRVDHDIAAGAEIIKLDFGRERLTSEELEQLETLETTECRRSFTDGTKRTAMA